MTVAAQKRLADLQSVLQISGEMVAASRPGQWTKLQAMEDKQKAMLQQIFATPVAKETVAEISDAIRDPEDQPGDRDPG